MKKRMLICFVGIMLILAVVFSLVAFGDIYPFVPEFKETVLKESYTDAKTMEKDMNLSKKKLLDYIDKYKAKLSNQEKLQLLQEYQQNCEKIINQSDIKVDPYFECVQNIKEQLDERKVRMVSPTMIEEKLTILYLNHYLEWLEQDRGRYIYDKAIQWAINDARHQYILSKKAKDAQDIEDTEYAINLLCERMEFCKEVEDCIYKMMQKDASLAEKFDIAEQKRTVNVHYYGVEKVWNLRDKNSDEQNVIDIINYYIGE